MGGETIQKPKKLEKQLKVFRKYKYLLGELVRKNIKLKYRNSVLGMFWTFLQPLLNMLVLAWIFGSFFGNNKKGVVDYPIYLLTGRLVFDFFTQSTKKALRSIRENSSIIKKVYVPKYMYPVSGILSNYVTFGISLLVLVVVMAFRMLFANTPLKLSWYILLFPIPLINLFILAVGVGMILATLAVFFRDVEYIYDVFSTLLFYMIPIVYPMSMLAGRKLVQGVIRLNPLYSVTESFRSCVLYGQMWNWADILYPLCFGLVLCLVGVYFFNKKQDKFILHI